MKHLCAHSVRVAVVLGVVAGCGASDSNQSVSGTMQSSTTTSSSTFAMDPGDGGNYHPQLDPARIASVIDNPYMPLDIGSRWRYEGEVDGEPEVTEIVVTADRRTVMGISAFVVRDTVTSKGNLVEDTFDWFTQDDDGNVWYLGEDSKEYANGAVVGTGGSWEAGVDGALPGIVMPAAPHPGDVIRQEFYAGEAEDMMKIVRTGGDERVRDGSYSEVLTTQEWTPLERDVLEEKAYVPGVGRIRETDVAGGSGSSELVEFKPAG